jgi:hypothetical protein
MCVILNVKIIFDGRLTEPPSSVHCFRDVTLYASCFVKANVLVECENKMKDSYYHWLKAYGAYDFIDEIVEIDQEIGIKIGLTNGSLKLQKITAENLNIIISFLNKFKR